MGFNPIKKVKRAVKSVVHGVGKVVKSVFGFVGKILNSKIGKIIMLAATVFTAGLALAAGTAAYSASMTASQGFMNSFVSGAKAFGAALMDPIGTAKKLKMFGGAGLKTAEAAKIANAAGQTGDGARLLTVGDNTVTTSPEALVDATKAAGGSTVDPNIANQLGNNTAGIVNTTPSGLPGGGQGVAGQHTGFAEGLYDAGLTGTGNPVGVTPPSGLPGGGQGVAGQHTGFAEGLYDAGLTGTGTPVPVVPKEGLLKKASKYAGKKLKPVTDFAKTSGGGLMLGQAAMGYASGKAAESVEKRRLAQDRWWDEQWHAGSESMADLDNTDFSIPVNPDYGTRAQARVSDRGRNRYAPTVNYGS